MVGLELGILDWISRLHTPLGDAVMPAVSFLGRSGWFWIVLGVTLLIPKKTRACGAAVLLGLLLANTLGNYILKPLIARTRPYDVNPSVILLVARETSFSFPSGHAITAFASAAAIFCFSKKAGGWALALAALVAFSRLYLYLHYPTDALAGALLGIACGWGAARLALAARSWDGWRRIPFLRTLLNGRDQASQR